MSVHRQKTIYLSITSITSSTPLQICISSSPTIDSRALLHSTPPTPQHLAHIKQNTSLIPLTVQANGYRQTKAKAKGKQMTVGINPPNQAIIRIELSHLIQPSYHIQYRQTKTQETKHRISIKPSLYASHFVPGRSIFNSNECGSVCHFIEEKRNELLNKESLYPITLATTLNRLFWVRHRTA